MQQIAVAAGMTTGTVYNHFSDKNEIVRAVGVFIAETVRERSRPARTVLSSGAEQVAAGCRRYLGLASTSPALASLVLEVAAADPVFRKTLAGFVVTELRKGIRSREFSVASEAAGLDLIIGTTMEGMRRIIAGGRKAHATAIVATVLCGLGVPAPRARQISTKRLPLFDA